MKMIHKKLSIQFADDARNIARILKTLVKQQPYITATGSLKLKWYKHQPYITATSGSSLLDVQ